MTGVDESAITMSDPVAARRLGEERRLTGSFSFPYTMEVDETAAATVSSGISGITGAAFKSQMESIVASNPAYSSVDLSAITVDALTAPEVVTTTTTAASSNEESEDDNGEDDSSARSKVGFEFAFVSVVLATAAAL